MRVLVTAASKHGSTQEIAEAIGGTLTAKGLETTVMELVGVRTLDGYDALVLGSAVYAGHWLKQATEFIGRHRDELRARQVWLFSSGPVGDPPTSDEPPADLPELLAEAGVREHRVFPGRLDRSRLHLAERAVVTALRAPEGDYRDWTAIRDWAAQIAARLTA